jgi:hypothetical protein
MALASFREPAAMTRDLVEGPLALRRRLSPGLPFREASWWELNTKEQMALASQRVKIGRTPATVQ